MKMIVIVALALAIIVSGAIANTAHAQTPPLSLPTGLSAARGAELGTVQLTWSIDDAAPFYHIGWVAMPNVRAAIAADRPWHEAFRTIAIENTGQSGHKVSYLVPGWSTVSLSGPPKTVSPIPGSGRHGLKYCP